MRIKYYPNFIESFGIVLIFIFLSIIFGAVFTLSFSGTNLLSRDLATLLAYILSAGATVIIAIRIKKVQNPEEKNFYNKSFKVSTLLAVIILSLSVMVIIEPITNIIPVPDVLKEMLKGMFSKTFPAFATAVIVAPVLEELIFRGIMLEGLLKNYNPVKAILITNIFFGLAHLNPWQFIGAFLIGIFISWIYMRTRSIILPIVIHFINNLISYMIIISSSHDPFDTTLKTLLGNNTHYYMIFFVSLFMLIIGIIFHKKLIPSMTPNDN
jgi:membrane protease YdiL (CAAX protease family)